MHTCDAIADIHRRSHHVLALLLGHCGALSAEQLGESHEGFGYSSIRTQLHHLIGAERYWVGVLNGEMLVDDDDPERLAREFPTATELSAHRERVAADSVRYLESVDDATLNTPQRVVTWGGNEEELSPALVFLRTQTHIFHHQGQVLAMCRLLGHPANGFDFPIR